MRRHRLIRGFTVACAFWCALLIGAVGIGNISDYKAMINDVLGVNASFSGSADDYAFVSEYEDTISLLTERKRIAEQIGEEGSVLLKNDGALPMNATSSTPKRVTVLGSRAYTYDANGNLRDSSLAFYGGIVGSPIRQQTVTVKEGKINLPITLENAFASEHMEINPALVQTYTGKNFPSLVKGSEANGSSGDAFSINEPSISLADCGNYGNYSDACFVVIGRASGEGREYLPGQQGIENKNDGSKSALGLSNDERNLIRIANQIAPGKVIVLINSAVAMEIEDLKNDDLLNERLGITDKNERVSVNAVLWIGLPGSYGMNGVARVISGTVSPSGHLSDTYAVDASASPAAINFGTTSSKGDFTWNSSYFTGNDNAHYVVLAEDLYTGYYYYETRYADIVENNRGNASSTKGGMGYGEPQNATEWKYEYEVSYSFGYGLSYTTFEQSIVANSFTADYDNKTVSVDVLVKNTGNVKAKSAVQLYMQSPYTKYDIEHGVEKSAIQLVAVDKVELEPGEETTVTLTTYMKYLGSYDKTVSHDGVTGGYILENDDYYFAIGNGAHEALNNVLAARGFGDSNKIFVENNPSFKIENGTAVWRPELEFTSAGINATLLSVSEGGKTIENQLADADYNYFKNNTVTYLSRNAWDTTFPEPYARLGVTNEMELYLNNRVYQLQYGSSNVEFGVDHSEDEDENGVPYKNLTIADMKLADFDDERWDYLIAQITFDEAWALAPYGGTSCNMFLSVNAPEVWQIDGPNGNITRSLGNKANKDGNLMVVSNNDPNADYMSADMPCEPMTAATFNPDLLEEQGKAYGEDMLWSRNGIIWAPGMNLHRTPFNSRNHEYYSEDPMLTNILGTRFVRGGLSKGAILAAKHFAFNTQESFREGLSQMMEEQSARELELRAFQGIFEDVNYVNPTSGTEHDALGLMSSFSRIGVCGVNAHTGLMKNILRGEWGFKGLSSTDMVVGGKFFNPQDAVINNVTFMATSNGDNLLNSYWPEYNNKDNVKNDPALCQALHENMHYYMYALANSSALNGISPDTVMTEPVYWWQTALVVGSAVLGTATVGLIVLACILKLRNKEDGILPNKIRVYKPLGGFILLAIGLMFAIVAFALYFATYGALGYSHDYWVIAMVVIALWSFVCLLVNGLLAGNKPFFLDFFYVILAFTLTYATIRFITPCLSPIGIYFTVHNMGDVEANALGVPRAIAAVVFFLLTIVCLRVASFIKLMQEKKEVGNVEKK